HDTFLVGRAPAAHFSLPDDPYFSRMHFLIEVNPPRCRLLDLESRNKTYVNGRVAETVELADGDEIRAGQTVLRVRIEGPTAPAGRQQPGAVLAETRPLPGAATPVRPVALTAGSPERPPTLPGYRVERRLGGGGMGVVWLAQREADGCRVAV